MMGPLNDEMKEALRNQITKTIATEVVGHQYQDYSCGRRTNKIKEDSYRKGPIPIEECKLSSAQAVTYGTLDSDCDDLDFEDLRVHNAKSTGYNKIRQSTNTRGDSIASCRALIIYFSKLGRTVDEQATIDLYFLKNLFDNGADVNFPDKHGQTILHEVARGWHPDCMRFVLENGGEINKADRYGRTPLHLASAVDYGEMVKYMIEQGADLGRETYEEKQTAMHYAAKNNAMSSLKVMLKNEARMNDRDYKGRTPLFVAAESGRADSARFLVEQGAPCGVYDHSGTSLLSLLIEKMPHVAIEAVEQFHELDTAFRKQYYYLAQLESDPNFLIEKIPLKRKDRRELEAKNQAERKLLKEQGLPFPKKKAKTYAKTPLEVIVQYQQFDLVMHPVFQRLLTVKWQLFGKKGSIQMLALNLFYTLIWTILGILIPRENTYYTPIVDNLWRIIFEGIGVILTVYFVICEINVLKSFKRCHFRWRQWRTRLLNEDLKFCHPRWPEEEAYLRSEMEQIKRYQETYFREAWNIFEWVTYIVIVLLALTRILAVVVNNQTASRIHPRIYAIGLIIIWLRLMRSCRPFRTLGPFIEILGSVISDTMKFAFLFFEFFIPYAVAFWIIFGGHHNAQIMDGEEEGMMEDEEHGANDKSQDWRRFYDLIYTMWSMSLMGGFNWDGLVIVDRLMAQILCGTYFALCGVICMNLYIGLLSDTFAREYTRAQANATMQQAKIIILLESKMNKLHRSKFGHYMQENCSPLVVCTLDEGNNCDDPDAHEDAKHDKIIRLVTNRIDELEDTLVKRSMQNHSELSIQIPPAHDDRSVDMEDFVDEQRGFNESIKNDIKELRKLIEDVRSLMWNKPFQSRGKPKSDGQSPEQTSSTRQETQSEFTDEDDMFTDHEGLISHKSGHTDKRWSKSSMGDTI